MSISISEIDREFTAYEQQFLQTMDSSELWKLLTDYASICKIQNIFYTISPIGSLEEFTRSAHWMHNYEDGFDNWYFEKNNKVIDWSIKYCFENCKPQKWSTPQVLHRLTEEQYNHELECKARFGTWEGLVVPIVDVNSLLRGGMGFSATHMSESEWTKIYNIVAPYLIKLSNLYHERLHENFFADFIGLEENERTVLQYLTMGYAPKELYEKVKITEREYKKVKENIVLKLKAKNRYEIVPLGLRLNLVK